jgi:hypothetical protein
VGPFQRKRGVGPSRLTAFVLSLLLALLIGLIVLDGVEMLTIHLRDVVLLLVVPLLGVALLAVVVVLAPTGVLRVPETASNPSGGIF